MCDGGHEFVNVQPCVRIHLFVSGLKVLCRSKCGSNSSGTVQFKG